MQPKKKPVGPTGNQNNNAAGGGNVVDNIKKLE
jgi:hypothetical protein